MPSRAGGTGTPPDRIPANLQSAHPLSDRGLLENARRPALRWLAGRWAGWRCRYRMVCSALPVLRPVGGGAPVRGGLGVLPRAWGVGLAVKGAGRWLVRGWWGWAVAW